MSRSSSQGQRVHFADQSGSAAVQQPQQDLARELLAVLTKLKAGQPIVYDEIEKKLQATAAGGNAVAATAPQKEKTVCG